MPPSLLAPFTYLHKARARTRYVTWDSSSLCAAMHPDLPIGRASNPQPSTISVLRRNLYSVTSLANTYKTWYLRVVTLHRLPVISRLLYFLTKEAYTWYTLQGSNLLHRLFRPLLWPHQLKVQKLLRGDQRGSNPYYQSHSLGCYHYNMATPKKS